MSDLSLPPLSLVPMGADATQPLPSLPTAGPAPQRAASGALAWPAPPSIGYTAPPALGEPEPCELEGPNGKVNSGRLIGFDPDAGQVQVLIPPGRNPLTLRFTQFRRLSLLRPLEPLPVQALGSEPEPLREPPLPLDPISPPEPLAQEPQLARRACSAPHRSAFAALPASPWARPLRD